MPNTAETGLIARYRERLPIPGDALAISLNEGSTPLVRLNSLCDPNAILVNLLLVILNASH